MNRYHGPGELVAPDGTLTPVLLRLRKDGGDWEGTLTLLSGEALPPWVSVAYNLRQAIRLRLATGTETSARVAFLRRRGGQADINGLGEPPF